MKSQLTPVKLGVITIGVIGVIGTGFILKQFFFSSQKKGEAIQGSISVQKTRDVMQQIKYQMLVVSVNYAQKITREMSKYIHPSQAQETLQRLRLNMMKTYEAKEDVILQKLGVSKAEYAQALTQFSTDEFLIGNTQQITTMMERACNGRYPDLSVPPEARSLHTIEELGEMYQQICLMVVKEVWRAVAKFCKEDPSFDTGNDAHFKKAIRTVNIYALKNEYLMAKGYKLVWGCPNEIFLKVYEGRNRQNQDLRIRIRSVEKGYNKLVDVVSNSPLSIVQADIQPMLRNHIQTFEQAETAKPVPNKPQQIKQSKRHPEPSPSKEQVVELKQSEPSPSVQSSAD